MMAYNADVATVIEFVAYFAKSSTISSNSRARTGQLSRVGLHISTRNSLTMRLSASKKIVAFAAESACSNSNSISCNGNCKMGGYPKTAARVESWRWSIGWSNLSKGPMSLWNLRILSFWLSELAPMEVSLTEEREDDAAAAATADALSRPFTPGFNGNHPKPDLPR